MFTTLFEKTRMSWFSRRQDEKLARLQERTSKKCIGRYRTQWIKLTMLSIGVYPMSAFSSSDPYCPGKVGTSTGYSCGCYNEAGDTFVAYAMFDPGGMTWIAKLTLCTAKDTCDTVVKEKLGSNPIFRFKDYANVGIEYFTCQWDGTVFSNASVYTWPQAASPNSLAPPPPSTAAPIPTYSINITQPEGGMVHDQRGWIVCGGNNYVCNSKVDEGLEVKFTAYPLNGYQFDNWTGDCSGNNKIYRFITESNMTCSAIFSKLPEPARPIENTQPTVESTPLQNNNTQPTPSGNNEERMGIYSLGPANNGDYHSTVRTTNVSTETITITVTLYAENGAALGSSTLTLQSQEHLDLTTDILKQQLNITDWNSNAWLEFTTQPGALKVDFLLTHPDGTVANLTQTRKNAVYNIPSKGNAYGDALYLQFSNTSDQTLTDITGTLYDRDGKVVGNVKSLLLPQIGPKAMQSLTSEMIEQRVGSSWQGRGWLQLDPEQLNIDLLALFQSKQGHYTNMTPVSSNNTLEGLPGTANPEDVFIRIINTSDQAVQVTGTLFDSTGQTLGQAVLADNLSAKAVQGIKMRELEKLMGIQPQKDKLKLVITSPTTGIAVAGYIRSPMDNVSNASVN